MSYPAIVIGGSFGVGTLINSLINKKFKTKERYKTMLDGFKKNKKCELLCKKCKYLKEAYEQAVWSDKEPDTRLDDGTTPIDDLDASEYSIFPFYDKLMVNIKEY